MDIGGLLGFLGLIGFVILIVGAGLAVAASSQGRSPRGGVTLAIIGLIAGVIFSVIGQGIISVQPTQVAIVTNVLNGTIDKPRSGGVYVIAPIMQQVSAVYDVRQQEFSMTANPVENETALDSAVQAQTKDGQQVQMDVTVIYRIIPEEADEIYRAWKDNGYIDGFVRPITRAVVRDVVSTFSAEEIYGEKRAELSTDIRVALEGRYGAANLQLIELVVREISFSDDFTAAIEQKVIALQNLERARTEAARVETEAEGRAAAAIASAQGQAQSVEINAKAQAEALRLVSEQLAANPSLIQYLYVQNLSDNVQLVLLPSNSPFLFDADSLMQQGGVTTSGTSQIPEGIVIPDATATPTPGS